MNARSYAEKIDAHYAATWGSPVTVLSWNRGPIDDLPAEFSVTVYRRGPRAFAYATRCMSKVHDVEPLELHILSRAGEPNPRYAEILTVVAHYHRTAAHLGLGHSLNLGEPLVAGSTCTHGVLSLPYLDGPRLEWMQSPRVRFLWLLPVTEQEVAYKQQHGLEALERRFEESGFDYLDPCRGSVVWGDARIPMDPEPC